MRSYELTYELLEGGGENPSGTEVLNPSDIIGENGASKSKLVI